MHGGLVARSPRRLVVNDTGGRGRLHGTGGRTGAGRIGEAVRRTMASTRIPLRSALGRGEWMRIMGGNSPAGGQPVRLFLGLWSVVLEVQLEGAVGVEVQVVAVADGESVELVRYLEAFRVVHGERPEGVRGRQLACCEPQQVPVGAGERATVGVGGDAGYRASSGRLQPRPPRATIARLR
jgi:hypothetical protein